MMEPPFSTWKSRPCFVDDQQSSAHTIRLIMRNCKRFIINRLWAFLSSPQGVPSLSWSSVYLILKLTFPQYHTRSTSLSINHYSSSVMVGILWFRANWAASRWSGTYSTGYVVKHAEVPIRCYSYFAPGISTLTYHNHFLRVSVDFNWECVWNGSTP